MIVGGGPAGYGVRAALAQLIDAHNVRTPTRSSAKRISTSSKSGEIGQHCLSGALLDPRSMRELLPGLKKKRLSTPKSQKKRLLLTAKSTFKLPITPPHCAITATMYLAERFVKWLGGKVEETGITIFTGFAGSDFSSMGPRHRSPH